jgi:hypothetical protein
MKPAEDTILINVNIEISTESLQTIVATVKNMAASQERAGARLDPADTVSELVSKFLSEHDFKGYVKETANYVSKE